MQKLIDYIGRPTALALTFLAMFAVLPAAFAESGSASVIVSHKVESYDKWKPVFDSTASWKVKFGWKQSLVFTADGDANSLTVIEEFDTIENAKKFASSPELKEAMSKAGVTSSPEVHFFNIAIAPK